jgi:hypothetical protein
MACFSWHGTRAGVTAPVERGYDDPAKFDVGSSWKGAGEREGRYSGCVPIGPGSICFYGEAWLILECAGRASVILNMILPSSLAISSGIGAD